MVESYRNTERIGTEAASLTSQAEKHAAKSEHCSVSEEKLMAEVALFVFL